MTLRLKGSATVLLSLTHIAAMVGMLRLNAEEERKPLFEWRGPAGASLELSRTTEGDKVFHLRAMAPGADRRQEIAVAELVPGLAAPVGNEWRVAAGYVAKDGRVALVVRSTEQGVGKWTVVDYIQDENGVYSARPVIISLMEEELHRAVMFNANIVRLERPAASGKKERLLWVRSSTQDKNTMSYWVQTDLKPETAELIRKNTGLSTKEFDEACSAQSNRWFGATPREEGDAAAAEGATRLSKPAQSILSSLQAAGGRTRSLSPLLHSLLREVEKPSSAVEAHLLLLALCRCRVVNAERALTQFDHCRAALSAMEEPAEEPGRGSSLSSLADVEAELEREVFGDDMRVWLWQVGALKAIARGVKRVPAEAGRKRLTAMVAQRANKLLRTWTDNQVTTELRILTRAAGNAGDAGDAQE
jgi:hypothetical protein